MVWWTDGTRRVAHSLRKLYDQVDTFAPDRSKIDDGTIGNEAHQQTHSEHNPDDHGIVRALDITHDPAHGVDTYQLADMLRLSKDHRIRYVISNSRIAGGEEYAAANHATAWEWGHYGGTNPHDHHMHVSVVGDTARYDLTEDWAVRKTEGGTGPALSSDDRPKKGDTGTAVEEVQRLLGLKVDSIFGAGTDAAVRAFQSQHGLLSDGIVGPQTWAALRSGKPPPAWPYSSKGSWYSQYDKKFHWKDKGDKPNSAALGVPDDAQGIAQPGRATLGKWFEVRAPNGVISLEQQTDLGPAVFTGRTIDISAAAGERFEYTPDNFPTDAIFSWRPADVPPEVAGLSPQEQATRYRDLRGKKLPPPPPVDPDVVLPSANPEVDAACAEIDEAVRRILEKHMAPVPATKPAPDLASILDLLEHLGIKPQPPAPPPPVTSKLDIGGTTGWKTITGLIGLVATVFGAPAVGIDMHSGLFAGLTAAFAALTSVGFVAKLDRGIKIAQQVSDALHKLSEQQQKTT